jgi:hypothetical protein
MIKKYGQEIKEGREVKKKPIAQNTFFFFCGCGGSEIQFPPSNFWICVTLLLNKRDRFWLARSLTPLCFYLAFASLLFFLPLNCHNDCRLTMNASNAYLWWLVLTCLILQHVFAWSINHCHNLPTNNIESANYNNPSKFILQVMPFCLTNESFISWLFSFYCISLPTRRGQLCLLQLDCRLHTVIEILSRAGLSASTNEAAERRFKNLFIALYCYNNDQVKQKEMHMQ